MSWFDGYKSSAIGPTPYWTQQQWEDWVQMAVDMYAKVAYSSTEKEKATLLFEEMWRRRDLFIQKHSWMSYKELNDLACMRLVPSWGEEAHA